MVVVSNIKKMKYIIYGNWGIMSGAAARTGSLKEKEGNNVHI